MDPTPVSPSIPDIIDLLYLILQALETRDIMRNERFLMLLLKDEYFVHVLNGVRNSGCNEQGIYTIQSKVKR